MNKMGEKMENFTENWILKKSSGYSRCEKNIVSEIKNSSVGFNSRLCIQEGTEVMNSNTGKQKIAKLKHRKKKKIERIEQNMRLYLAVTSTFKCFNY